MPQRRSVLRTIGSAVGVAAATGIGTAATGDETDEDTPVGAAGAGNDRQLPVYATGTLRIRYVETGEDTYTVHQVFQSEDLRERYGDPEFRYEPRTVPEDFLPEAVQNGDKRRHTVQTSEVIGTRAENVNAEAQIWRQTADTGALDQPTIDGEVPLYQYKESNDAENENKQSRGAPFNVAWESKDVSTIKNQMESGNNGPIWINYTEWVPQMKVDQYVNLPDEGTKSTDAHVMKHLYSPFCDIQTRQYHLRLYEVPFDGIETIAQAHKDPCDHGHISDVIGDVNWRNSEARGAAANFWEDGHGVNHETPYVGNTTSDFDSHDGSWAFFDG